MKKKKDSKATSKKSIAKHIIEDMSKNGRFYRRKNWGYYWLELSGIKDNWTHPGRGWPYPLLAENRYSLISIFIANNYGFQQASRKNFSIVKELVKEAEINGDDYDDFNEPDKISFLVKGSKATSNSDGIAETYEVCDKCGRKLADCYCVCAHCEAGLGTCDCDDPAYDEDNYIDYPQICDMCGHDITIDNLANCACDWVDD